MTSMRRRYVASTSSRRHVPAGNLPPPPPPKILNLGPPNFLNLPTPMQVSQFLDFFSVKSVQRQRVTCTAAIAIVRETRHPSAGKWIWYTLRQTRKGTRSEGIQTTLVTIVGRNWRRRWICSSISSHGRT